MLFLHLGMVWFGCAPPTNLLARVAKRIRNSQTKGLVLVPNWPASDFFNAFFDRGCMAKRPFQIIKEFNPFILQNENARHTPLYGITKFSFFVLYFDTYIS